MPRVWKLFFIFSLFLFGAQDVLAAMTSSNYQIQWDAVSTGGSDNGTSTNFGLRDSLGTLAAGSSTSATYQAIAGYRALENSYAISLDLRVQDGITSTGYSALSVGSGTVTVSSTSGFALNDYIAVVENSGFSQRVVSGRITNINSGTSVITVDAFAGAVNSIDSVPAAGTCIVYRLTSGSAMAFGNISLNTANDQVVVSSVLASTPSGYSLYLQPAQGLRNASNGRYLTPVVAGGAVAIGTEGYGTSVTGTHAYNPNADIAVTSTQRIIQQSSSATSGSSPERVILNYKLSVTADTLTGAYSQSLYYTLSANF